MTGGQVVGVDITQAYVDAATALTVTAGLSEQVEFVCADVDQLGRSDFDAAYTMHVQMNVADKGAFFGGIADRLRPGAPLATFEICRSGSADPNLPLPWSIDGVTVSWPRRKICSRRSGTAASSRSSGSTRRPGCWTGFSSVGLGLRPPGRTATLPALLADGPTRMMNLAAALYSGILNVRRGSFKLAP